MGSKKLIVNIKGAIQKHNLAYPDDKLTATRISEMIGISDQTASNMQNGKVHKIVGQIREMMRITGATFEELVVEIE